MAFNGPMYKQERLSKDEIKLLKLAINYLQNTHRTYDTDTVNFLAQKLERMENACKR